MNPFADFDSTRPDTLPEGERALVQRFRPVGATGRKACVIGDDSFLTLDLVTRLTGEGYEVAYVADPVWARHRHESRLEIDYFEPNVLDEAINGADHVFVVHYRFQSPDELWRKESPYRMTGDCYLSANAGRYYFLQEKLQRVIESVQRPPDSVVCAYPRVSSEVTYSFVDADGLLTSTRRTGVASVEFGVLMDHQYGAWYGTMRLIGQGMKPRRSHWSLRKRASKVNVQPWISTRDLTSLLLWTAFERIEGHLKGFAPDCPRESEFFAKILRSFQVKAPRGGSMDENLYHHGWTRGFCGAGRICDYSAAESLGFRFQDNSLDTLASELIDKAIHTDSFEWLRLLRTGIRPDLGDQFWHEGPN